jgi:Mg-chelatase subunit ChlD
MKKTLEWTHPALHLVQKALVAAVAIIAAVGLLAVPVPAYADSTLSLPAPDHAKYAELDPATGKIKITLSVTGKTDASQSKTSANVIVVLDTSGSMDDVVSHSGTVHYVAEDSWRNGGQYGLVNGEYVQLTRKSSWWGYTYYYYTDSDGNQVEYTGQRYKQSTDVTRLDVAKQALSNLADQLIASSDSTVKIALETFSGNGNEVSDYYGAGHADEFTGLVNKTVADGGTNWAEALAKANEKASKDTSTPTYIVFLSDGMPTYGMRNGHRTGNGTADQSSSDLAQFVTDAVNTANARPDNVYGFYAIYTGSDAASSMNSFASRTNASPKKAAIDGSNSTDLNNAFKNIVTTIQSSISYTNVKITDPNSEAVEYVLPTGSDKPTFTYTKGGETWSDAPTAYVENDSVVWDLGNRTLDPNVTYSVSFEVKLKQEAYNAAAPADGVTPVTTVDTNKTAQLAYSTVITKDGVAGDPTVQDPVAIPSRQVDVPTSKLAITKTWVGEGDKPSSITLKIKQDGHEYKTVTVQPDAAGNWATTVDVATGPDGHSYTIDEEPISGWTETTKAAGATFKNLFTEYSDQNIENTFQSGKLTLTKTIKGNAANSTDTFTFDLSCPELKNKEFRSGNKTISFDSEGKATVDLTNGETIELNNVPASKAIVITERASDTPNAKMTTVAKVGNDTTTFDKDQAKTVRATVADGGTTEVVYTNRTDIAPDTGLDISTTSQGVLLGVAAAGAATLAAAAIRKNHGERKER